MKISRKSLRPAKYEIFDAAPLDVQKLVKFGDRWNIELKQDYDTEMIAMEMHDPAADDFEMRFQDYF